jgi:hypothetical protein
MYESDVISATSFADAFGYRIFFPTMKTYRSNALLKSLISNTIDGSNSLTEIFTRICKLGCLLIYKPHYKCLVICPNKGSFLEIKIKEFEEGE